MGAVLSLVSILVGTGVRWVLATRMGVGTTWALAGSLLAVACGGVAVGLALRRRRPPAA